MLATDTQLCVLCLFASKHNCVDVSDQVVQRRGDRIEGTGRLAVIMHCDVQLKDAVQLEPLADAAGVVALQSICQVENVSLRTLQVVGLVQPCILVSVILHLNLSM